MAAASASCGRRSRRRADPCSSAPLPGRSRTRAARPGRGRRGSRPSSCVSSGSPASRTRRPWPQLVDAWRESVAAFERYGHVFEAARSRARLAVALRAAGDHAASRDVAEQAREVAVRLEAKPLLAELDDVRPGRRQPCRRRGSRPPELTPRELEVLALLAQGLTNGQIGKQLYISTKTVSVHVSNLLAKLGASGRTEAAAIARRRGLVS